MVVRFVNSKFNTIIIPREYYDIVYDICIRYCFLYEKLTSDTKSNRLFLECYHAMKFVENKLRKHDAEDKELSYDQLYYLFFAIDTLCEYEDIAMNNEVKELMSILSNT